MADWSQLPTELLQKISEKLKKNEIYLVRFRSVCSTWRSSVPKYTHNIHFPLKFQSNHLIRHKIFLIKPPETSNQQQNLRPWLIRIGPNLNGTTHLWKPLDLNDALPFNLPPVLDFFNRFPVLDLGHTFVLFDFIFRPNRNKVVAATCDGQQPIDVVAYDAYWEPKMFRFGGNCWTSIFKSKECFSNFVDICIFKGRPCVVLPTGLTVLIRPDLSIHLLADPFCDRFEFKAELVESEGQLLLVDRYSVDDGTVSDNFSYNVFRLNEKEKKWVKLTTLGDRVLFLGDGCSFSASASDLGFSNGNCIIFNRMDMDAMDYELKIFHLDQGKTSPLSDYPDDFKLFGPPPEWIAELHT